MSCRILSLFLVTLACIGCSHKKSITGGAQSTSHGLVLSANWVKPKGGKFDMELQVRNDTGKPILLATADLQCSRGATQGVVRDNFSDRERLMSFAPNQTRSFKVFCVNTSDQGSFRVGIARVFGNPSNDGVTKGPVVASNVEWLATEADIH